MSERNVDQYNVGQLVSGESLAGRTLFVAAVHGEAERLPKNVPLLVTGIGTVPTAISVATVLARAQAQGAMPARVVNVGTAGALRDGLAGVDRKSTRLNSSHVAISYAVFCSLPHPPQVTPCPYTTLFRSQRYTVRLSACRRMSRCWLRELAQCRLRFQSPLCLRVRRPKELCPRASSTSAPLEHFVMASRE